MGSMSSARKWCLAVSQSPNMVITVGGRGERFELDSVKECIVI